MEQMTQKQKDFFDILKKTYGSNPLPSLENIKNELGFKSKNSIAQYFSLFKKMGLIEKNNSFNYINKNFLGANLFSSKVRAGFGNAYEDFGEKLISFDEVLELHSPSTFVFKVSGDSMVDLGIYEDDFVVIKKTADVKDKDIVLANVDGNFTLKTYRKTGGKVFLQAHNPDYNDIYPKNSLSIFGVAIGISRRF